MAQGVVYSDYLVGNMMYMGTVNIASNNYIACVDMCVVDLAHSSSIINGQKKKKKKKRKKT